MRDDLTIFNEDIFESVCIELQIDNKNKILICVICRPPNIKIDEFANIFKNVMMKINRENKKKLLPYVRFKYRGIKNRKYTATDSFINQLLSSFYPFITKSYIFQKRHIGNI